MNNMLFKRFFVLTVVLTAIIVFCGVAFAAEPRYEFQQHQLDFFGTIAIPLEWTKDSVLESDYLGYYFFNEEMANRYGMMRLIAFQYSVIEDFTINKVDFSGYYEDIISTNFGVNYEFKSYEMNINGIDVIVFGVANANFWPYSTQTGVFLVIPIDGGVIEVFFIDDHATMQQDSDMYDTVLHSFFGAGSGTEIFDDILKIIG